MSKGLITSSRLIKTLLTTVNKDFNGLPMINEDNLNTGTFFYCNLHKFIDVLKYLVI